MRRAFVVGCYFILMSGLLIGCAKKTPPVAVEPDGSPEGPTSAPTVQPASTGTGLDAARQERYDGMLRSALNQAAERKYADALAVLEGAQAIHDTPQVRREIERVRSLLTQKEAAEKTAHDIHTVLKDGDADEAARLAGEGLKQFGGGDDAAPLAQLKQQADAVAAAGIPDRDVRRARFTKEGETALKENNLRAALLAFEQALEAGADDNLRKQVEELRATLGRYDERRQRAAELRRDPAHIEDAVAALEEAARAWDTLQVRQQIDEYKLALLKRRDRASVADFEVRGDVDIPAAGRTIAEELLPALRAKFDVVERGQLNQVIDQLKLQPADLEDDDDRREIGRLAQVRYLVLGSVSALGGVTVNARLVDVRTGLVVQTGQIMGRTPQEAIKRLPQLARMLTMSDDERIALQNELAQQAEPEAGPIAAAPVPPAPAPLPAQQAAPAPVVVFSPRPPAFGAVVLADFARPLPPPVLIVDRPNPFRDRFVRLYLMLGDNLFLRARYGEAYRYYELAFSLAPGEIDIRIRLDRTRPFLAPPPVVIVPPVVFVPIRPRIAVLSFYLQVSPVLAPPGYGDWAADYFASQMFPWYDVVDRGELFWYMGRLGLTVQDVIYNPWARLQLARALNVRFFVLGTIVQTASFNVDTHLIDAETGARHATGGIHVQDRDELKLRMNELARQLQTDPAKRGAVAQQAKDNERQLSDIRRLLRESKAAQAADLARHGLQTRPNDVALRTLLQQAEKQARESSLEEARSPLYSYGHKADRQRQAQLQAERVAAQGLTKQAEAARLKAQEDARVRDDTAKKSAEEKRDRASADLVRQADEAVKKKDYGQAVHTLQSALALKSSAEIKQQLAHVRSLEQAEAKARAAEEKRKLDEARSKKQEEGTAKAKIQLDEQRKARLAQEETHRKSQEAQDLAAQAKLLDEGKNMLAQGKLEAAIAALQSAQQLHKSDEVAKLLADAHERLAKAQTDKKSAEERAQIDKKLAEEKKAKDEAEAQAKKNRDLYTQALDEAQKALDAKQYDQAIRKFQEANKLFPSDVVRNGIRQAEAALAKQRVDADAEKRKKELDAETAKKEDATRQAEVQKLVKQGRTALAGKDLVAAAKAFDAAAKLAPKDAGVLQAQQELAKAQTASSQDDDAQKKKRAAFDAQLAKARQAMVGKRFDEAVVALNEADKLMPNDKDAAALRKDIDKARTDDALAKKKLEDEKRLADYRRLMQFGQQAMAAKRYDQAAKSYAEALKLQPDDPAARNGLAAAQKALVPGKEPAPKPVEKGNAAEYNRQMQLGATLEKQQKLAEAAKAYQQALQALPDDPKATAALKSVHYTQAMNEGNRLLATKRFADAARQFEEALRLRPESQEAAAALKKARMGK